MNGTTTVTTANTDPTAVPGIVEPKIGEELLSVSGLVKHFPIRKGVLQRQVGAVQAVDGLTFNVTRGETLSLVGSPVVARPQPAGC